MKIGKDVFADIKKLNIIFIFARYLSYISGIFFYYLLPLRKKVQLKNLNLAFLNKNNIKSISKKNYIAITSIFIEILILRILPEKFIRKYVKISKEDYTLISKYDKRLIFLTGHFGNWEIAALSVALQINRPFYVLGKKQSGKFSAKFIKKIRERFGNKEIYTGLNIKELLSALNDEKALGIVGDQRGPKESIQIEFFGRKTFVQTGFAKIAIKTDTPILLGFVVRNNDYLFDLKIREIDYKNINTDFDGKVSFIMQTYFSELEKIIRLNPEQYFWLHNIWKY